jgi:hypothetical protein
MPWVLMLKESQSLKKKRSLDIEKTKAVDRG